MHFDKDEVLEALLGLNTSHKELDMKVVLI